MRSAYGLETPRDDTHWAARAACLDHDPEAWSLKPNVRDEAYRMAHKVCARCPVISQCYEYGVKTGSVGVILGGVDFTETGWRKKGWITEAPDPLVDCPHCKQRFPQKRGNQTYCSRRCTDAAATRRHYTRHRKRYDGRDSA